jgi:mutator protein MutT
MLEIALALVQDDSGRWLVSRRADDVHLGGLWEFPGGKIKLGESVESAAVREALEEVGVVLKPGRRLEPIDHRYPDRSVRLYPVICEHVSGDPKVVSRAVTETRWVATNELLALEMPEANAEIVERLSTL